MKIADRRRVPEASAKPSRLAFKTAEAESGQLLALDEAEGIVTAIVSVTGTEDEVADIIVPGAYRETLAKRRPKVCWAHSWEHPIGRVLYIEELMPGDDRLPSQTKDGSPWPREAGALVATMQFNLRSDEGKNAFSAVVFYSETGECEYSIGYQVPAGRSTRDSKGVRHIKMLELYELSVVLFGAHTMTGTISIKEALKEIIERKNHRGHTGTVRRQAARRMTAKDALAAARSQRKAAPPFEKADKGDEKKPVKPTVTEKDDLPQHDADTNLTTEDCPCGDLLVFDTGNGWQRLDGSYNHDDGTTHSDWILPPEGTAAPADAPAAAPADGTADAPADGTAPAGKPADAPGTPAADAAIAGKIGDSGDQTLPDHSDGVMIALYPDPAAADQIAQAIAGTDNTLPRSELHVTLAYLGTVTEVGMSSDEIIAKLTPVLEGESNLTGTVGGIGQFPADPETAKDGVGAPTWVPVDVEGLGMLRETIAQALGDEIRSDHGFTPHMTIGYGIGVIDPLPPIPVTFDSVHVVYGTQDRTITLGSNPFIEGGDDETKDATMRYLHLTTDEVAALTALAEVKAGGADRNRGGAEELRKYWTSGAGGAKIRWGTPGDFTRCVRLLEEHMPGRAEGYCFTGDTEFLTRDGVTTFAEAVGTDVMVLTQASPTGRDSQAVRRDGRWVEAPIRSYGEQPVLSVVLSRNRQTKVVRATPEHEWFASTDARSAARGDAHQVTTSDLRPGMALASLMPGSANLANSVPSPFGIAAGVVFGDGHVQPSRGAQVDLWGAKDAHLLRYFPESRQEPRKTSGGVLGVRVSGMPASWKDRPSLDEGTSYLYGWLAGYIAADGTVGKTGAVTLSSARRDDLVHAAAVANRLGIATHGIRSHDRVGLGTEPTPLHRLTFVAATVPDDLLVLPEHRRRFAAASKGFTSTRWTVVAVEDHGEREEVFCAEVPDTETFALADYVWVHNCANRHKEMTGMWPGDKGNKSAEVYDPSLDGTSAPEDPAPSETKGYPRLSGSYEERNDALAAAAVEALRGDEYEEGRWEWPGVCIDATFDESIVVTRHKYDGTDERQTFQMPYSMNPDGSVDLGPMEQVELEVVAINVDGGDGVAVGDVMPFAEGIHHIAHHFKVAHDTAIETKAGRVLSGQNERRLRQAVENLVNVLANAGLNIRLAEADDEVPGDLPGGRPGRSDVRKPPPPEADLTTTSPSGSMKGADTGVIEVKGDVVVLDAASVEDMLRGLKIED